MSLDKFWGGGLYRFSGEKSGGWGGVKGHIGSYHCCLFGVVHLFNTHLTSTPDWTFPSERRISMYLMFKWRRRLLLIFLLIFISSSSFRLSFLFYFYSLFKGLVSPGWLEAEKKKQKSLPFLSLATRSMLQICRRNKRGWEETKNRLVVPKLTLFFLSITMTHCRFGFFFPQFLIRQNFSFKKLIIVLRCWVLDSNYYSGCCCYIISFRVDFILHYFVLHCCNLHWF